MQVDKFYQLLIKQRFAFSTDSRNIENGCIFFALKGDNFNGNKYALEALNNGAAFAVIDEDIGEDDRLVKVDDVLTYFQKVATFHRRCYDIPVLAIAGSNGKTTTKNLVEAVLSRKYKTHCTKGNFNNHIGVPITLLEMPQDCEFAIVEIGTNNPGEIADLCRMVEPNFGIITNIGKEHLEGFGTLEAVAKEESELFVYLLQNNGLAFINADDTWLSKMKRNLSSFDYSKSKTDIEQLVPSIQFRYKSVSFSSHLMGDYNLDNILSAVAIGEHFNVDIQVIADAIAHYTPDNNRSQIVHSGTNTIWLDAYNANPSSMEAAIENFSKMDSEKLILILGDMFEMGATSKEEHISVLQFASRFEFDAIYLLGEQFSEVAEKNNITPFDTMDDLKEKIRKAGYSNSAFLVKGSRGMKMERVLEAFDIEN